MSEATKIEWCDSTWNPITGCLHGCEYCYARGIARRFAGHWDEKLLRNVGADGGMHVLDKPLYRHTTGKNRDKPVRSVQAAYPYDFDPTFHRYRLDDFKQKKPRTIFVGSMADMFGEWVPDEWIKEVFETCAAAPQHRYLFLTKNPDRYYQLGEGDEAIIPDAGISGWFGASAATEEQAQSAWENLNCTWMSLEPLHGEFDGEFFIHDNRYTQATERRWNWIVVGAETGNRKDKVTPERKWIENIVENCRATGTPLFMKNSLAQVWQEPLIQEYPWEVQR